PFCRTTRDGAGAGRAEGTMKGWQRILRDSDPGMERMDADTAARMRNAVVAAASAAAPSPAEWPMRLALAAFACLVMMLSVFGTQRPREIVPSTALPVAGTERR